MNVYLKIHIRDDCETVACCDKALLNNVYTEGNLRIEITDQFFGGRLINIEDAIDILKTASFRMQNIIKRRYTDNKRSTNGSKDDVLMPNRFCAICGNKLDKNSPHFGMCIDCYLKEHPLFELPDSISVNVCLDCGSYAKKDIWIEPSSDDMISILQEIIQKYLVKQLGRNTPIETLISFDESSIRYSSRDLI
ncbi:MAG: DUF424 family protein, partial [Promethearchaeota archaeon]